MKFPDFAVTIIQLQHKMAGCQHLCAAVLLSLSLVWPALRRNYGQHLCSSQGACYCYCYQAIKSIVDEHLVDLNIGSPLARADYAPPSLPALHSL